jgi:cytochrome b561
MAAFSTRLRYGAVAQVFHWVAAILVLAAFIYGPGGSERRVYSLARGRLVFKQSRKLITFHESLITSGTTCVNRCYVVRARGSSSIR